MTLRTPFDSLTLAAVLNEISFLEGAKVQRIIQPDEFTLTLGLYASGIEHQLLINWHPELFRIHLLNERQTAPGEPPTLAMTLRKYIGGGRIEFIRQRGLDRIVDIAVTSSHGDFQVVLELMGRHSNIMLVDSNRRILAVAKTVSPKNSKRPIRTGHPYEPPPFDPKPTILEAKADDNLRNFEGSSPFLTKLTACVSLTSIQDAIRNRTYTPHLSSSSGAYPLNFSALDSNAVPAESLSLALQQTYAIRESRDALHGQRQQLQSQLQRVADARSNAIRGIQEAIATADRAQQIQTQAELILAYQGSISEGQTTLEAFDYDGNPVTIKLDSEKTAVENANRLFNKAKHAKERRSEVASQQTRIQQDLTTVNSLLTLLESASTSAELDAIRAEAKARNYLHQTGAPKAKEERPFGGFSIRELLSPGGYRVLYGTNATSNDYLTNRIAKGNDLWFHVRGQTSAHVVLQTSGQPDKVQKPDLIFAAQVSVRNSVAKHGSYVPVDYTLKKYVRKPRGSAAGLAVYEREKTLHVDP